MISLKWINLLTDSYCLETSLFTFSASWPFTKHCERIQKFRETDNWKYIYKNERDKVCFARDATYSDSKPLAKRAISYKILKERAYEMAINTKYERYQRGLANMVYKPFNKKQDQERELMKS